MLAWGWYDEAEDWRNHPLFQAKGRGQVRECRGRVHLRAVFVDDDESVWVEESRELYRYVLGAVGEILEANGPEGLVVTWSTENRTLRGVANAEEDEGDAWVPLLMGRRTRRGSRPSSGSVGASGRPFPRRGPWNIYGSPVVS